MARWRRVCHREGGTDRGRARALRLALTAEDVGDLLDGKLPASLAVLGRAASAPSHGALARGSNRRCDQGCLQAAGRVARGAASTACRAARRPRGRTGGECGAGAGLGAAPVSHNQSVGARADCLKHAIARVNPAGWVGRNQAHHKRAWVARGSVPVARGVGESSLAAKSRCGGWSCRKRWRKRPI